MGGTFQPIHNGHLEMARLALSTLSLDRVVFLIAGNPPHKVMQGDATDSDRLAMVRLAAGGEPVFDVCTDELAREGPSYTVDTLRAWKAAHPEDELFFLMGSDMLRSFPHWREPEALSRLADIACITRAGQSGGEEAAATGIERDFGGKVHILGSVQAVSSTEVRSRVFAARSLLGLVPDSVATYMYQHLLYQPPEIGNAYERLSRDLTGKRLAHSLYTMQRAIDMAERYGCDPERARLAALLHDCAKQLPQNRLEVLSGEAIIIPPVLHACAGAVIAKTVYGVLDDATLRAIRLHSTGDSGMTTLDKILYLADITEQTRDFPLVSRLRAETDLDRAMLLAIKGTLCYIQSKGLPLHPSTLRAYQSLGGQA